jgi:GNAT superfamily N-acetyltransferase
MSATEPPRLRDFTPADAPWLIAAHTAHYCGAEGFDATFPDLVARVVGDFVTTVRPGLDRGFVLDRDGQPLGSVICVGQSGGTAQLRLFLLDPSLRGHGQGRRLLDALTGHARSAGFARVMLWTHASHTDACALYRAYGFALAQERPVRSFGQELVEQQFVLALSSLRRHHAGLLERTHCSLDAHQIAALAF